MGWAAAARPRAALALALGSLLLMAPGLLRLRLRTDGRALVPAGDAALAADRAARQRFGLRDPLLVVVETSHPDGIFNPATLDRLRRLTGDLAALTGLGESAVQSLATESGGRFQPGGGGFRPLLDPPPRDARRLAEVRQDVEAIDLFHGTLVSFDRRAAAVLVGAPEPRDGDRAALYARVSAVAGRYQGGLDRVSVVGAPAVEALLGEHVLADLARLLPSALAVIAAVLWAACGRAWGMAVGLTKIGAAQVFTFGLIGWLGEPVYLTTAVVPVILTTIGLPDEMHLLWRFRHRPPGQPPEAALRQALAELGRPIVLTSLATAIGFLSFLASPIAPVRSFGLATAVGVLYGVVWAVTGTPALLALRPGAIRAAGQIDAASPLARLAAGLAARPRFVVPVLAAGTALLALGIPRLATQDGWLANFAVHDPLRQASERVDRRFCGTHVLRAVIDVDPPPAASTTVLAAAPVPAAARGPLLAGQTVEAIGRFEQALRAQPEVGCVLGLAGQLTTMAYLWGGRNEEFRQLVDDPDWIYLNVRRLANVRGEARRRELIDDAYRGTVVTLLLRAANFRQTARLVATLRAAERRELWPVHARVHLAGDVAVSQAMIPAIVRTQLASVLLAVLGNLVMISLLLRSPRAGVACLVPSCIAVVWTFGVMGWLDVPLGVATSTFCAVTLGIGLDYGIHYYVRFQTAERAGLARPGQAASLLAGPSILLDALAVSLGFGLLALSAVPANRRLGLLVALALASSCLLTLVTSGALLGALGERGPPLRTVQRSARHAAPINAEGERS